MRSLKFTGYAGLLFCALGLSGCLVSDDPILDAKNGKAAPLIDGRYDVCTGGEDSGSEDCNVFTVSRDSNGAYSFIMEGEDPAVMRFRRIARKSYAVQSKEDDSYAYYFGAGDSRRFLLTMMNCADLPPVLRARLIEQNDLSTEHDDFEICTVNTLKGLVDAARAYHRGEVTGDDPAVMVMKPAAATE